MHRVISFKEFVDKINEKAIIEDCELETPEKNEESQEETEKEVKDEKVQKIS